MVRAGPSDVIGDHTDYQAGWVLPLAVAEGATVNVEVNDTSRVEVASRQFGIARARGLQELSLGPSGWSAYVDGALSPRARPALSLVRASPSRATCRLGQASRRLRQSPVPPSPPCCTQLAGGWTGPTSQCWHSGSRTSTSVPVSGTWIPPLRCSEASVTPCSIDTRSRNIEQVPCALDEDDVRFLLIDSGVTHATSGAEYAVRVAQCQDAASLLRVDSLRDISDPDLLVTLDDPVLRARARHVVTENSRVLAVAALLRDGRVREVGTYLTASHASLRDDFDVSTSALEMIVNTAMDAGALGARVTGAGLGALPWCWSTAVWLRW